MTPVQKQIIIVLSLIAVAVLGASAYVYFTIWQKPLGPTLSTATPFGLPSTWTPDPNATNTPLSTLKPASTTQAESQPPLCGAQPIMNLLLIGSDSRGDSYTYGLADMIRIARIDFVNAKVTVLEFPRDLWVEIPDIADNLNGQDHEKLNQAYLYGNRGFGYTTDPAQGPGLLARTLALNFGVHVDHYAAANMQTFVKLVNTLGGIDVYLPKPVDGRTATDLSERLVFKAGTLHLDGERALTLARIRIKGGFARGENQNRVLCALRNRLAQPDVIEKIPTLIQAFEDNIQTDLSPQQISQIACIGAQIEARNIHFANFPEELFTVTRQYDPVFKKDISIVAADFDILRDYVEQFHAGTFPSSEPTSNATPNPSAEVPICP